MFKIIFILSFTFLGITSVFSQSNENNIIPQDSFDEIFNPADILLDNNNFDKRLQKLSSQVIDDLKSFTLKQKTCNRALLQNLSSAKSKLPRGLYDELYFLRGLSSEMCGDLSEAKNAYDSSLKLRSKNPFVLYRLASIHIRNKNYREAQTVIQEAEWQGFKDKYLLLFLRGVIKVSENNYSDAIALFQQSLFINPHFLPAAKAQYRTRTEFRKTVKDTKVINQLDSEIPLDLARLVALDPKNTTYLFPYLRYLLSSGNILKSPAKLNDGLALVDSQLKESNVNFSDFALIKVQFLEKLNKTTELMAYLDELEKNKKITPNLKAKKDMLIEDQSEEQE